MYVGKEFTFELLWHFARKNLLKSFLISLLAVVLYDIFNFKYIGIPFLPIGTIGTAVAFFVGFKNNQAYDRLWEARRLWGGITNASRSMAVQMIALIDDKEFLIDFLHRHIAYVNILRLQLRRTIPWATSKQHLHQDFVSEAQQLEDFDEGLKRILTENNKMKYYESLKGKNNTANIILKVQAEQLTKLKHSGKLDGFEHTELMKHITEFFNLQGGCERIKTTPLFRQYSIFSQIFVSIFMVLLPFGLLKDLGNLAEWSVWLTIPFSVLISWIFYTMESVGEYSENPFDNAVNDTPISTICRNIEIDIKELLGEANIPAKLSPENNILL